MTVAARVQANQDDVPVITFNPNIASEPEACTPSAQKLEQMKKSDPKLRYSWSIWEQLVQPKDKSAQYSDATRQSASFSTVREFWGCWNHLPQPSELLDGKKFVKDQGGSKVIVDALMVFRTGVKPQWEDPHNKDGGHFQLQLKPQLGGGMLDDLWNKIVLGMIGGCIEPAEMVTGVRLVDKLGQDKRPTIRIEVWFNDMSDNDRVVQLRHSFEKVLRMNSDGSEKQVTWGYTETKPHSTLK